MQEQERIISLFQKLYSGSPWIDVNILDALRNLSASDASTKMSPGINTIWQIVNHIIDWRFTVLKRVQGEIVETPANNYFEEPGDVSQTAWDTSLLQLEKSQQMWVTFLGSFNEKMFEEIYKGGGMTYYEHIHGIIQHDAYHLGQIVLLSKMN